MTRAGPSIAVIGYCQADGLRDALTMLCPNARVRSWRVSSRRQEERDAALANLSDFDLIVSQVMDQQIANLLHVERLREKHSNVVLFPTIVFSGFQPDCIYLRRGEQMIAGMLHHMHSAIIAGAFALGLPPARTARLFNAATYERLGFFDAFTLACDFLKQTSSDAGIDVSPFVDDWKRSVGCFMYTLNHPHICVLTRVAHLIATKAGFIERETALPNDVPDALSSTLIWPVYPEIARHLNLPVEPFVFKRKVQGDGRPGRQTPGLAAVIAGQYERYHEIGLAEITQAVPARIIEGLQAVLA